MILLSVIIPTYNERENIALLLQQLTQTLSFLAGRYEILVVDDQSPDGTVEVVQDCAYPAVRVLQRSGVRDLSCALADGFDAAFIQQYVNNLVNNNIVKCCICGWTEILNGDYNATLFLIEKDKSANSVNFTAENLDNIYKLHNG